MLIVLAKCEAFVQWLLDYFNCCITVSVCKLPTIPVKAPRAELQVWVAKTNKNKN